MFQSWSDNNTSLIRTITLNADTTLTATYALVTANLTLLSNPTGLSLTVDGNAVTTPMTLALQVGTHTITASQRQVSGGGQPYMFQQWSDGDPSLSKTINLQSATTLTATYVLITHTLSINSNPSGINFTVNGGATSTPYSAVLPEGSYLVALPNPASVGGSNYSFQGWSDGVTTPSRTIDLTVDTTLSASYQIIIPTNNLTVNALDVFNSPLNIAISIDGIVQTTPYSASLPDGTHTLTPVQLYSKGGDTYVFQSWSDGVTIASRTINLTTDLTLTAVYRYLAFPVQITSTGVTGVPVTIDGAIYSTPFSGNLRVGAHTISVPSSVTIASQFTSVLQPYTFQSWNNGVTTPGQTLTINGPVNLNAAFISLQSWNPHVPYTPLLVSLRDILGTITAATACYTDSTHTTLSPYKGATLAGGWNASLQCKRDLNPENVSVGGTLTLDNVQVSGLTAGKPLFVQINKVSPTNSLAHEDWSSSTCGVDAPPGMEGCPSNAFWLINSPGGGKGNCYYSPSLSKPYPLNPATGKTLPFGDYTWNVEDRLDPNYATNPLLHTIHVEIDRDWQAQSVLMNDPTWANNMIPPPATGQLIDIQGFIYWDPGHTDVTEHSCSGFELHPLTAWRPSQ